MDPDDVEFDPASAIRPRQSAAAQDTARSAPRTGSFLFPWFPRPLEPRFRIDYAASGHSFRIEMWLIFAICSAAAIGIQAYPFDGPDGIPLALQPLFLVGVALPILLVTLTSPGRVLRPFSGPLFVASALMLIACITLVRAHELRTGDEALPLTASVAALISPLAAQIRFPYTVATIVTGAAVIIGVEIAICDVDGVQALVLMTVASIGLGVIGVGYRAEATIRSTWLLNQRLHATTRTDLLTGLPNRRRLFEALRAVIGDSTGPIALTVLDIDDFKAVNDELGHLAGDDLLRAIGQYLISATDPTCEFPARLAGEEFVVFWRDTRPGEARRRAEELRRGIASLDVEGIGGRRVTASAGFALSAPAATRFHDAALDLLERADAAMYTAKESGRDRLVVADRTPSTTTDRHEASLPAAEDDIDDDATADVLYTGFRTLHFDERREAQFRRAFAQRNVRYRRRVMYGGVALAFTMSIVGGILIQTSAPDAQFAVPLMWFGLLPGTLIAVAGVAIPMLRQYSGALMVLAVLVTLATQMAMRFDLAHLEVSGLSFLRPTIVIVSLCIIRFRYEIVAPATVALLVATITVDMIVMPPADTMRIIGYGSALAIVVVGLRLCYREEYTRRIGWAHARRLAELTRRDPLTSLPNRREFDPTLRRALMSDEQVALVLIDIDRFKAFNDSFGHLAGDDCLRTVGEHLAELGGRPDTFVARLGGEEFAVVLTGGRDRDFAERAEDIRAAITELDIPGPIDGQPVTASAGMAIAPPVDHRPADLDVEDCTVALKIRADHALYRAKASGRDNLVIAPARG